MQIFFFFEMPFEEDPKARSLGALLDTQHLQILQNLVFFSMEFTHRFLKSYVGQSQAFF